MPRRIESPSALRLNAPEVRLRGSVLKESRLTLAARGSQHGMSDPSHSDTPLRATFEVRLNGKTVSIATVGQAYRFITNLSSIEWLEFRALHEEAIQSLENAAENAMLTVQETNALRTLLARAKLL